MAPSAAKLVIVEGDGRGEVYGLAQGREYTLGRSKRCDIHVSGEQASRAHCHVIFEDGYWVLRDLGSSNGTFVNDRRVGAHRLQPDDVIRAGETVLRFEAPVAAEGDAEASAD